MNGALDDIGTSRTILEIQDKIDAGDAVVLTATEICARIRAGGMMGSKMWML